MGETRDLLRKLEIPRKTFHAKVDTIKDRNNRSRRDYEKVAKIQRRTVQKRF